MIVYKNVRYLAPTVVQQESHWEAFVNLAKRELQVGGRLATVSPTKLRGTVSGGGFFDDVTYEGSEEAMAPLHRAAQTFNALAAVALRDEKFTAEIGRQVPSFEPTAFASYIKFAMGSQLYVLAALLALEVRPTDELWLHREEVLLQTCANHLATGEPFEACLKELVAA